MNRRILFLVLTLIPAIAVAEPPAELKPWLTSLQSWKHDTSGPIVSLGAAGEFDDTHIFAPSVVKRAPDNVYQLWYCGSTNSVAKRVFHLGLATSPDGRAFRKHQGPVLSIADGKRSVLTPCVLRNTQGFPILEGGELRMWFSSTWFEDPTGKHSLHETSSTDGITWSDPSPEQLLNCYAPSVLKTGRLYQMWFTDISQESWFVRHAWSEDGRKWRLTPEPAVVIDQAWERSRLFYPHVIKVGGVYLMWYGSYWTERPSTTAIGLAASIDGMKWHKHPKNPVHRPSPERPWESHYVTSHAVIREDDGSLRMWYASRKTPPHVNKYFALNTAVWRDPPKNPVSVSSYPQHEDQFVAWQSQTRQQLREALGIPREKGALDPDKRGELRHDGIVIEKWVFTSEPGSRVPALLYRPERPRERMPAIVLTYGHGGSKSAWQYHYAGQLYAKLGLACLAIDPIGEEERHARGGMGTRAHDRQAAHETGVAANRLIMGKLVFDTMRGIDFLEQRSDVDSQRIGVAGNSLGGAVAGWMAALEPRIKFSIVSGWTFADIALRSKNCTKVPTQRMREVCSWRDYAMLAKPCSMLFMNGDADWVIDRDDDGSAWSDLRSVVAGVRPDYGNVDAWFEAGGGHRPYFAYKEALKRIHRVLGTPGFSLDQIQTLPTLNAGEYCDANAIQLERLYGTDLHQRGATLPDLGIRPLRAEQLAVLESEEAGKPEFTLAGWLESLGNVQE